MLRCGINFSSLQKSTKKRVTTKIATLILFGEPEGTRTPNLLIRSQVLYPIKLQVHKAFR